MSIEETPPLFRHTAALVKAVTFAELMALLSDAHQGYAISEKANGERFMYNPVRFSQEEQRNRARSIHNAS